MHISEGILTGPALVAGAGVTVAGVTLGLRRIEPSAVPRVAVLSSAFFVASLIHVPIGPVSGHLVLNGLSGLLLGWGAFPAILIGLLLQAVLFGHGGITVLGVNTANMAVPAVVVYYLFRDRLLRGEPDAAFLPGAAGGALAVALSGVLTGLALLTAGKDFLAVTGLVVAAHAPVVVVEGLIAGSISVFVRKVKPELLHPCSTAAPPHPEQGS